MAVQGLWAELAIPAGMAEDSTAVVMVERVLALMQELAWVALVLASTRAQVLDPVAPVLASMLVQARVVPALA